MPENNGPDYEQSSFIAKDESGKPVERQQAQPDKPSKSPPPREKTPTSELSELYRLYDWLRGAPKNKITVPTETSEEYLRRVGHLPFSPQQKETYKKGLGEVKRALRKDQ